MDTIHRLIFLKIVLLVSTSVVADYTIDFAKISCDSDAGIVDINYHPISNNIVDSKDITYFQENELFDARKLVYECHLFTANYSLSTTSDEVYLGTCGAAPDVWLNLSRNGVALIRGARFGEDCGGEFSITRISIREESIGNNAKEAQICIKQRFRSEESCFNFFDDDLDFSKRMPITQESVRSKFRKFSGDGTTHPDT